MSDSSESVQKITAEHLGRKAVVYLRQSSPQQVKQNKESRHRQYALVDRAKALGFGAVEVIDCDLGASAGFAAEPRAGFKQLSDPHNRLVAEVLERRIDHGPR